MTTPLPIGRRKCRDCRSPLVGSNYLCAPCLRARLDRRSRKDQQK